MHAALAYDDDDDDDGYLSKGVVRALQGMGLEELTTMARQSAHLSPPFVQTSPSPRGIGEENRSTTKHRLHNKENDSSAEMHSCTTDGVSASPSSPSPLLPTRPAKGLASRGVNSPKPRAASPMVHPLQEWPVNCFRGEEGSVRCQSPARGPGPATIDPHASSATGSLAVRRRLFADSFSCSDTAEICPSPPAPAGANDAATVVVVELSVLSTNSSSTDGETDKKRKDTGEEGSASRETVLTLYRDVLTAKERDEPDIVDFLLFAENRKSWLCRALSTDWGRDRARGCGTLPPPSPSRSLPNFYLQGYRRDPRAVGLKLKPFASPTTPAVYVAAPSPSSARARAPGESCVMGENEGCALPNMASLSLSPSPVERASARPNGRSDTTTVVRPTWQPLTATCPPERFIQWVAEEIDLFEDLAFGDLWGTEQSGC